MRRNPEEPLLPSTPIKGNLLPSPLLVEEIPAVDALIPRADFNLMLSGKFPLVRVPLDHSWMVKPAVVTNLTKLLTRSGLADPNAWYDLLASCSLSANLFVMDRYGERYKVMDVEIDPGGETGILILNHLGRRSRVGYMRVDIHEAYGKMLPFVVYKEQRRNPRLTKSKTRVLASRKPLRNLTFQDLDNNLLLIGPFGPVATIFGHDASTHLVYFLEDDANRDRVIEMIKEGSKLAIFQRHIPRHMLMSTGGSIPMFWKQSLAKKYLAGALQFHLEEWSTGNVIVLTHMAVKPRWRRNRLNTIMIQYLLDRFPGYRLLFHEPTQDGKAYMQYYGGEDYDEAWRREPKT